MSKGFRSVVFLVLALLAVGAVSAVDPDDSKMHPSNDRTGVLYDKIIDYLENMNAVQEHRHCVLGKGQRKMVDGDEIKEVDLIKLLVVEPAKKLRFAASATIVNPLGRRSERWGQSLEIDGTTIIRNSNPANPARVEHQFDKSTPEDERPSIVVKAITPFDDAVRMANGIDTVGLWHSGFAESLFMTNAVELDGADFDKDGNIVSNWRNRSTVAPVHVEIVFSKQVGYNPVRARYYLKQGERSQLLGEVSTTWEMQAKHWLPTKQEAAHFDFSGKENYVAFKYQWKMQDDFATDLIVADSNDWREPFRILFKEEWVRPGRGIIRLPEALQVP